MLKLALVTLTLATSLAANAGPTPVDCSFEDYQKINAALDTQEIRSGEELKIVAQDWLAQEMGPTCSKLIGNFGVSIPGQKMQSYEIENNGEILKITLVESLEENAEYVRIQQLQ